MEFAVKWFLYKLFIQKSITLQKFLFYLFVCLFVCLFIIKTMQIPEYDELYCNYSFVYGQDWAVVSVCFSISLRK